MRIFWRGLKFVVCIFSGGAVASLLLLIVVSICIHDMGGHGRMIDGLILFARIFGGVCGGLMMYRFEWALRPQTRTK